MNPAVLEQVTVIVARHLQQPAWEIPPDVPFADLGADEIDHVEIAWAVEESFGVSLSDEHLETMKTVNDVVRVVDQLLEVRNGTQAQG